MDGSIRPVRPDALPVPRAGRRRRSGDPGSFEEELGRGGTPAEPRPLPDEPDVLAERSPSSPSGAGVLGSRIDLLA